jgi:hypothetical protein
MAGRHSSPIGGCSPPNHDRLVTIPSTTDRSKSARDVRSAPVRALFGSMVVIAVVAAIVFVMGFLGPAIAAAGLVLAVIVLADPAGLGSRLRRFLGGRSLPGMRSASSCALAFSSLLVAYSVPVPMGAFALSQPPDAGSVATTSNVPVQPSASPLGLLPAPTPIADMTVPPVPTAAPTPSASPSATSGPALSVTSTPMPLISFSALPSPTPSATPVPVAVNLCAAPANPWGYNFCGGAVVMSAPSNFCRYFVCVPLFWSGNGALVECRDGMYSHVGNCSYSHRGGLWRFLDT